MWPNLFFIELSKPRNSFVKTPLVLEIRNFVSFIKTRFYWKQGCIKMRKYGGTFYANKDCKFAIVTFIPTSLFLNINLWFTFETLFAPKWGLSHMKMNGFNNAFHMTWAKWQRFQFLRSSFSTGFVF